jgi:glycosyltransferase involved in cell wall biosynthesis
VRRIIRAIDPDIVHGQGTERFAAISSVYSGKPCVLTIHGNMRAIAALMGAKPFSFHWLTARLEAFTLPRADGIVCLSNYTCDQVTGLARKTWVVANATGNEFFQESTPLHEPPVLFCPAIICPRKNQNVLLRALDQVASKQSFRLVLAGGHNPESAYGQEFLEMARTRPWCEYMGNINHAELPALHGQADLMVLPSVEDNCPMAILEAFAAGKPVAASGVCGILDLVSDGREGVLFDPHDPQSMAAKISGVLANREELLAMGKRARATADAKHSPRAVALAHLDIYREVLESKRR